MKLSRTVFVVLVSLVLSVSLAYAGLKGDFFQTYSGNESIRIISTKEMEVTKSSWGGSGILLAKYTVNGNTVRVVIGNKIVEYYEIVPEGLKAKDGGSLYYNKTALEAERLAKKAREDAKESERLRQEAARGKEAQRQEAARGKEAQRQEAAQKEHARRQEAWIQADQYHKEGNRYFAKENNCSEAIAYLTKAIELTSKDENKIEGVQYDIVFAYHHNALAWYYVACPNKKYLNGKMAVELAQTAVSYGEKLGEYFSMYLDTLASAYAEVGDFEKAVATQKQAVLKTNSENVVEYRERIKLYADKISIHSHITAQGRFSVDDEGIITDHKTGLQWYVGRNEELDWNKAGVWVSTITVGGGGWRMPTEEELKGLYMEGISKFGMTACNIAPVFNLVGDCSVWSGDIEKNYYSFSSVGYVVDFITVGVRQSQPVTAPQSSNEQRLDTTLSQTASMQPVTAPQNEQELLSLVPKLIRDYYNNNGQWAGVFQMDDISNIRTEQKADNIIRCHVEYKYIPVPDNPKGRTDTGVDRRTFDIRSENGGHRVISMGAYQSASF